MGKASGILAAASAVLGLFLFAAGSASAAKPGNMEEFGQSKPPVGYVRFCAANPDECRRKDSTIFNTRASMTPDMWEALAKVNSYVNSRIRAVSDEDLYGEVERWTYPVNAGDCEDYVLLKKRYLEGLGFSPTNLLITVVLDENNSGHAVLTVQTTDGDYLLDNRRDQIVRWTDSKYTFLKRQSPRDPLQWLSLTPRAQTAAPIVSTRSDEGR